MTRTASTITWLSITCGMLFSTLLAAEPPDDVDALLATRKISFRYPPVGPVSVEVSSFWEDEDDPWLQLRATVADLPHIDDNGSGRLVVTHVWNRQKQDVFNPEKWNSEIFQSLTFDKRTKGLEANSAVRNIHLKAGTGPDDIDTIEGTLYLRLPTKVETLQLAATEVGKTMKCAEARVILKKLSGKNVSLTYRGDDRLLRSTKGYDSQGTEIDTSEASSMTMGKTRSSDMTFAKGVDYIRISVARRIVEKKYPFVLKR